MTPAELSKLKEIAAEALRVTTLTAGKHEAADDAAVSLCGSINDMVKEAGEMKGWMPGQDRSMEMWNTFADSGIKHSLPLLFKTVAPQVGIHIRLGYYDGNRDAFIESEYPALHYRKSVECWYQPPMPPTTATDPESKAIPKSQEA